MIRALPRGLRILLWVQLGSLVMIVVSVVVAYALLYELVRGRATDRAAAAVVRVQNCYDEQGKFGTRRQVLSDLSREEQTRLVQILEDYFSTLIAQTPTKEECADLASTLGVKR